MIGKKYSYHGDEDQVRRAGITPRRFPNVNRSLLADQLGLSISYVSSILSGRKTPSADLLSLMAAHLGGNVRELKRELKRAG